MSDSREGQWNHVGARWDDLGPPLRPAVADIALFQRALDARAALAPIDDALILGVTPEIFHLAWPETTRLRALDRSADMIATVWPGTAEQAIAGSWLDTPFADATFAMLFCDGGLQLLAHSHEQARLTSELARIVAPRGHVVFRLFLPATTREDPEAVIAELAAGGIANMNCLKLRLGAALMESAEEGIALGDFWHFLHDRIGDRDAFFAGLGWDPGEVSVIDFYRDSPARYHFVDVATAEALFGTDGDGPFRLLDVTYPDHLMGDRCAHFRVERV